MLFERYMYIPKKYILTLICLQDDSSTPIYIGYINRVKIGVHKDVPLFLQ